MTTPMDDTIVIDTPPQARELPKNKKPGRQPPYHVIIWNDEEHTFEYVIELLMTIFGHSLEKAAQITKQVHFQGKGVAFTTHKELAELKRDQILSCGPDWRMEISTGPIRASIEPAPD